VSYFFFKKVCGGVKMLTFGLFLISFSSFGQYANSWINFNQAYYKISVSKEGIYKLTYSDLQSANFPVNSVDPRLIKLYHRGTEQAIFVQGEADAVFNASDFIEFYGKKNDGTRDKNLYKPTSVQPHSFYNLYNDTTAYFLTYSLIPPGGKRMASFSEVNVTNMPKETFHNEERLLVLGNRYAGGNIQNNELQYTFFDQGEGWTGTPLQQTQSIDYVIDLANNPVTTAGLPQLEMMLVGWDNISHAAQVWVGANSGSLRVLADVNFFGFETPLVSSPLNWSDLGTNGKMSVRITAGAAITNRFQLSTSYIKLTFPQRFDALGLNEKVFRLPANASNKSYIEIDNPAPNLRIWDVSDADNVSTIGTTPVGSSLSAVVATSSPRNLLVSNVTSTPLIQSVSFRQMDAAVSNFLIISNRALTKPALGYSNVVQAYADYRASVVGGKYDTLTVTVDQLYNQFNYGETSSLAIYEFMKYMVGNGNPKYLFIIGKGRDISSYSAYQRIASPLNEFKDLVPSAGLPASDAAYSAGLGGTTFEQKVPTGRLPASTPMHVAAYLNKIKETEAAPITDDWKKQGLHLSGGIQSFELPQFKSYVDGFKAIAQGNFWGGNIATISKREPNPVQLINVSDQVNKGVNMITFFGHSSPGNIDIDIGFVTDPVLGYNNPGKYPVFLINGCNAGAFFLNGTIFGEDWIFAANKGARNFIAHSSFGFPYTLLAYSDLFYRTGFGDSTFIQKGIGDIQKEVAHRYLTAYGGGIFSATQVQQMVLLGDPAVKLFGTSKPDYSIDNSSLSRISLDGAPVTSLSSSLGIKIIRKNMGAAGIGPVPVRIIRTFSDNTSKTYDSIFPNVFIQDTIVFKLKREANGAGLNQFTVVIDPLNTIKETNKLNNTATFSALIPSNGTKNLLPAAFAITNKQNASLVFQSTDLVSDTRDFQVQLDTASTFDSPYLKTQVVSGKVLAKFSTTLLNRDSTTYYWRTKLDKAKANESIEWNTTSFSLINNSPEGWGQLQFPQYMDNEVAGLLKDLQERKLRYLETITPFSVSTFGSNNPAPVTNVSLKINNVEYNIASQGLPCRTNTINFVAFNKNTTVPYAGIPFNFQDPRTCGREPQLINSFLLSELETGLNDDLATYVDAIQQSDSVLIFSIGNPGYQSWSSNVKTKLGNFGISVSQIDLLQDGEPIVILGRKGAAVGSAKVFKTSVAPANEQPLAVSKTMTGRFSTGSMKSAAIGPAKSWVQLIDQAIHVEATDQFSFSVYGISLTGSETLLQDSIAGNLDLGFIDATLYPYLKLELKMQDPVNLSAIQLRKWMVLYEPVAEGILVYKGPLTQQTIQEGQAFSSQYGFVNFSEKSFPSQLTVRTDVLTKNSGITNSSTFLIDPPRPGDTTHFSLSIDSKSKVGLNEVTVFVNPKILPEQYYDNNILSLPDHLNVKGDGIPPVLNVTVDGRHLRNNDFVSNSPKILIELKDENPFLFKADTVGMNLFLKIDCNAANCPFTPIYFNRSDISWSPAAAMQDFKIHFNPQNLQEGLYTLRVEGADVSGNKSGTKPYEVDFEVNDTTALTLQSVYPNPSSSSFFFSFVLSGNILPSDFSLQIISTNGKTIRHFTYDDVQHFNIGSNELQWSGTDSLGDLLPNGIYLYKLRVAVNGKNAAQIGKLVVAR
jgi:Peptidase family C25